MKKQLIELNNLQWLFSEYGMSIEHGNTIVGIDYMAIEDNGVDLVVYDVGGLDYKGESVLNYNQLVEFCNENGKNEEDYEIDRVTLIKSDK